MIKEGQMVRGEHCFVSALFDSGKFMHFSVGANAEDNLGYANNIQTEYGLSSDDFLALEVLICGVVDKYLSEKDNGDYNDN
jgi:hypothetical protein